MFKSITARSITTRSITFTAAATVTAGFLMLFTSIGPEAKAATPVISAVDQAFAKGDRLPAAVLGAACSQAAWPHYEKGCQFDRRGQARDTRVIRIIALR